jgi:hypothetical protein
MHKPWLIGGLVLCQPLCVSALLHSCSQALSMLHALEPCNLPLAPLQFLSHRVQSFVLGGMRCNETLVRLPRGPEIQSQKDCGVLGIVQ